ncbi:protein-lysine N-methyltransferase EEF2KMT [Papilio machaon]|uniref:protein-lysine N-methyltransferase EEF2KMT n=1 Tax=Papilio machaon TaxID=76193 RepID=UPI001E664625|nr:protein-lysine N-methyltransferase EEF2KMT [Papilio machaon]
MRSCEVFFTEKSIRTLRKTIKTYAITNSCTMADNNKNIKNDTVHKLVKNFFIGSLKYELTKDEINELSLVNQEIFLRSTIHSSLYKKYPLKVEFCRLFFKKLIKYLEYSEVHDDIYEFICSLMKIKNEENKFSYRHYIIENSLKDIITIKETNNMVINGTTGMKTWEAAIMLSDWILCNKKIFYNQRILELGSGVGFTGIIVGKYCMPKSTTLTDCHSDVLDLLVENIIINFPDLQKTTSSQYQSFRNDEKVIDVAKLDWQCPEDVNDYYYPDIVIGADIIYDPSILLPLCNVLNIFFNRNPQLQVYIASIIRNEETFNQFLEVLDNINVAVDKVIPTECVYLNWDQEIKKYYPRAGLW